MVVLAAIFRPRLCPPPVAHLERPPSLLRLLVTIVVPLGLLALMLGLVISGLA